MRQTISFNTKWAFTKMADEPPVVLPDRWIWVNIPHTWNAIDGQDGGSDYWRGTAWYAKEINKRDLPEADRYYIQFDGTNARAKLFVNGALIASHDGGYSAWRVDLTDVLDETNLLAVAVNNEENKEVYPQNADFTFYGGIYRDVKILAVSDTHFDLDSYGGTGLCVTAEVTEDLRAKYALDESQEAALIAAGSPGARAGQKDVHTSPAKIRVRTWIHPLRRPPDCDRPGQRVFPQRKAVPASRRSPASGPLGERQRALRSRSDRGYGPDLRNGGQYCSPGALPAQPAVL